MTANSSESVILEMKGRTTSGASVWPTKMLAVADRDSVQGGTQHLLQTTTQQLDHPPHDAEVIKNKAIREEKKMMTGGHGRRR